MKLSERSSGNNKGNGVNDYGIIARGKRRVQLGNEQRSKLTIREHKEIYVQYGWPRGAITALEIVLLICTSD